MAAFGPVFSNSLSFGQGSQGASFACLRGMNDDVFCLFSILFYKPPVELMLVSCDGQTGGFLLWNRGLGKNENKDKNSD